MSARSPLSSHHLHPSPSRSSNGLRLQDISHLPIVYPDSGSSPTNSQQDRRRTHVDPDEQHQYVDEHQHLHAAQDPGVVDVVDEDEDDDDDEWVLDREYIDLGAADAYGGYGALRPRPMHRESQDVEFGNRLTSMRSLRGRGRGMHMRLPRQMMHGVHMKGLQRGKTALLKTLRRAQANMMAGHHHSNSSSGHSPPYAFEFRDPQPAPESIRQQYAELASPEPQAEANAMMRTENGHLAPPAPVNGPDPSQLAISERRASLLPADADADARSARSRHSRSHSDTPHSQVYRDSIHRIRPRSRSVVSRRSALSADTVVGGHSSQMHGRRNVEEDEEDDGDDTAETTLVQHFNDLTLTPIHHSPSSSKHSKLFPHPHSNRQSHLSHHHPVDMHMRFPHPLAFARHGRHSRSRFGLRSYTSKTKSSIIRAVKAFNRLPWMAAHEDPRGALVPTDYYPTPRITKDFIPSRSDRAKLRAKVAANPAAAGVVYKKKGVSLEDLRDDDEVNGGSWYRPNTRQVQRAVRREYYAQDRLRELGMGGGMGVGMGMGGIARPVKQAYASYRAVAGRGGRPLDYMYASSSGSRTPISVAPSLYSSRQHSGQGHSHGHGHSHSRDHGPGHQDRHANASTGSMIPRPTRGLGVEAEVGAALYGLEGRPGSIAAAASAYLTRSASSSTAQATALSPPHLRMVSSSGEGNGNGRKNSGVVYASAANAVPPAVSSKGDGLGAGVQRSRSFSRPHPEGQPQHQKQQQSQQQIAYAYAYPAGQPQAQTQTQAQGGQPVQYYAYGFTYPDAQGQGQAAGVHRARVPGSSPPLPPIPIAPSSSLSYAPSSSGHGHGQVQRSRSANNNDNASIPTIPTTMTPSASTTTQPSSVSSYSYTRPHGHGHQHQNHGHRNPHAQHRREYSQHGHEEYNTRPRYEAGGREAREGYAHRPTRYASQQQQQRSGSGSSTDSGYGTVLAGRHPVHHNSRHHGMPMRYHDMDYALPPTYVR